MPFRKRMSQGISTAFTLIELLVVITIVAILAAFLLTVLSKAKGQAQSAYCKNNLRQQGLAMLMYVDDSKFYPYYQTWEGLQWEMALQPYYPVLDALPNTTYYEEVVLHKLPSRAYQCPAYTSVVPDNYIAMSASWWNNWSYSYIIWGSTHGDAEVPNLNYCLGLGVDQSWLSDFISGVAGSTVGVRRTTTNLPACRESLVTAPSELFALMDSRGGSGEEMIQANQTLSWGGWDWAEGTPGNPARLTPPFQGYQTLAPRPQHGTVFNVLFADGHVSDVKLSYLFNPTNSARHWNVDNKPHPESWQETP